MGRRVERTRNGGKWTEAKFWGHLRSHLRNAYRYWHPTTLARNKARRRVCGIYQYQCSACGEWFTAKEIQVDHIEPCGSLKCYDDLPGFVERLFSEDVNNYRVMCKGCHQKVTNQEREERKKAKADG